MLAVSIKSNEHIITHCVLTYVYANTRKRISQSVILPLSRWNHSYGLVRQYGQPDEMHEPLGRRGELVLYEKVRSILSWSPS
jgi:hypothetical protein